MSLQEQPRCFECREEVDPVSLVFEALCGHETCPSAVFHGVCLMRWREEREQIINLVKRFITEHPEFEMIEIEEDDL